MSDKLIYKDEIITIELTQIEIYKSYRDLLCGRPTNEINERVISNAIENAKRFCETDNIFLFPPDLLEISLNIENDEIKQFRLPYYTYIGNIECYPSPDDLVKLIDSSLSFNDFGLIWFKDELSIDFSQSIIEFILKKAKR